MDNTTIFTNIFSREGTYSIRDIQKCLNDLSRQVLGEFWQDVCSLFLFFVCSVSFLV